MDTGHDKGQCTSSAGILSLAGTPESVSQAVSNQVAPQREGQGIYQKQSAFGTKYLLFKGSKAGIIF